MRREVTLAIIPESPMTERCKQALAPHVDNLRPRLGGYPSRCPPTTDGASWHLT